MEFPQRGEIWLVSLDPTLGTEIGKTRPAVIISNNRNNEYARTITVIPITSNTKSIYPFDYMIFKEDSGLNKDSKAKCGNVKYFSPCCGK